MKAYIITEEDGNRLALIGTYEAIFDYIVDPYYCVQSFKKCKLIGSGDIHVLAESTEKGYRLYRFKSKRHALQIMETVEDFIFSQIGFEYLSSKDDISVDVQSLTTAEVETTQSEDIPWTLDGQSKAIKEYRSSQGMTQKAFAKFINNRCNLYKDIKQTDVSKIERGLHSFEAADWKQIYNIIKD